MTDERRFAGYLAGWTFLATVCVTAAGVAAETAGPLGLSHTYLAVEGSGPAARLASHLPSVFFLAVAGLLALVPVVVATVRLRRGADSLATGGLLVAGLALFPGLVFALSPSVLPPSMTVDDAVVGIGVLAVGGVAIAVLRGGVPSRPALAGQFLHVGLLLVVLVGGVAGVAFGGIAMDAVVETDHTAMDDGHAVVTMTHTGGESIRADRLTLVSDEFANVSSAEQTAPGPWQGSVSGSDDTVTEGDSVTVGVERDCTVRVVYSYQGTSNTIGIAHCEELR